MCGRRIKITRSAGACAVPVAREVARQTPVNGVCLTRKHLQTGAVPFRPASDKDGGGACETRSTNFS
jgi:hypothetical protein